MKKLYKFLVVFLACIMLLSLCACGDMSGQPNSEMQAYIIQYTDNAGVHSIEVQAGMPYSIKTIPQKTGYEFLGLFDAEEGGTQYVNSGGSGLSVFTDNQNIVLYPQFRAKEYTLILDYQGAAVTGSRSMKVSYGSEIVELPLNLTMENKNFRGWFTEPDQKGKQIADQYGVLPENRKVTENVFDLSDSDGNIKLYAGFQWEEFTVTFYTQDGSKPKEVKVPYGTAFDDIKPNVVVNDKMVLSWSKRKNDVDKKQIFSENITNDVILYAAEYAPFLEFDSNGGNVISSMVARAGDIVQLPSPEREGYKFLGWKDPNGNLITSLTMPEDSMRLVGMWQAIIMFDANGGSQVENISEEAGAEIELPVTDKAGYRFAGWYMNNGQAYNISTMPSESITLKAGWYKEISETVTVISSSSAKRIENEKPSISEQCYMFDFSKYFHNKIDVPIRIVIHAKLNTDIAKSRVFVNIYSQKSISTAYLLASEEFSVTTKQYRDYSFEASFDVNDDFYICWSAPDAQYFGIRMDDVLLSDFYYTFYYTDTTVLIL